MVRLSNNEKSTITAALRWWQRQLGNHDSEAISEQLQEGSLLTIEQIDTLCKRLEEQNVSPAIRAPKQDIAINNDGGFLTYNRNGDETCIGYLLYSEGHGAYDVDLGLLTGITAQAADEHNRLFDRANLDGLDNCSIDQTGLFYWSPGDKQVKTFLGTIVSESVEIHHGTSVNFTRKGRIYHGHVPVLGGLALFARIR